MNSIELLKQELKDQKSAIESKGGTVSVASTNVSPSEITAGIKSINTVDCSIANATEEDVLSGKTFFAGNNTIKTGTLVVSESNNSNQNLLDYVFFGKSGETYPNLEIHFPDFATTIKEYAFYNCKNKLDVYMTPYLTNVGTYAFHLGTDTTIHDMDKAVNLTKVDINSFRTTKGIELSALPSSLANIGNYAFTDCAAYSNGIALPASLTTVGNYAFSCSDVTEVQFIDLSQAADIDYSLYMFQFIKCLSNLVIPEGIKTINSYFNYNGSMKSVTFPTSLTRLNSYSFGCNSSMSLEDLITESYTFLSVAPPSLTNTTFTTKLLDRTSASIKFYVPDESVEAYKNLSNLSAFSNYIHPISEKE